MSENNNNNTPEHLHNPLRKVVLALRGKPQWLQRLVLTRIFRHTVKLSGTVKQDIIATDLTSVTFKQRNLKRVQNHIGGVHAAGTALLGESATGFVVGTNLPGDKLPLLKSMQVEYVKRATGDLTAHAHLSEAQLEAMRSMDKGEVSVAVTITDAAGINPVEATYIWAWIPKKKHKD
jgi:acyl-coenzyme A thioesterase PaaI-like protein